MSGLYRFFAGLGFLILAALALFFGGRRSMQREIDQRRAIDRAEAFETRGRIEDEISDDPSLLDRARNNGVVRNPR